MLAEILLDLVGSLEVCVAAYYYTLCKQYGLCTQRPLRVFLSPYYSFRRFHFPCEFTVLAARTVRPGRCLLSFCGISGLSVRRLAW